MSEREKQRLIRREMERFDREAPAPTLGMRYLSDICALLIGTGKYSADVREKRDYIYQVLAERAEASEPGLAQVHPDYLRHLMEIEKRAIEAGWTTPTEWERPAQGEAEPEQWVCASCRVVMCYDPGMICPCCGTTMDRRAERAEPDGALRERIALHVLDALADLEHVHESLKDIDRLLASAPQRAGDTKP